MDHFGVCELSVLPVRKNPHSTNELVTQILYGEIFTIIEKREKWSKISNYYDKYEGWVNNAQINFIDNWQLGFIFGRKMDDGICKLNNYFYDHSCHFHKIYI